MRKSIKQRQPRGNAPVVQGDRLASIRKGGTVAKPAKPASQRASTEIVRAARVALAEAVLREMYETSDDQWAKFNKDTDHVSAAEKLRKGAEAAGKRFDKIADDARRANEPKKP
jgi:hypothetical protein